MTYNLEEAQTLVKTLNFFIEPADLYEVVPAEGFIKVAKAHADAVAEIERLRLDNARSAAVRQR